MEHSSSVEKELYMRKPWKPPSFLLCNFMSHTTFSIGVTYVGIVMVPVLSAIRLLMLLWYEKPDFETDQFTIRTFKIMTLGAMALSSVPFLFTLLCVKINKRDPFLVQTAIWMLFFSIYGTIPSYLILDAAHMGTRALTRFLEYQHQQTCNATQMIEYLHSISSFGKPWGWSEWDSNFGFEDFFKSVQKPQLSGLISVVFYLVMQTQTFLGAGRLEFERYIISRVTLPNFDDFEEDFPLRRKEDKKAKLSVMPESNIVV